VGRAVTPLPRAHQPVTRADRACPAQQPVTRANPAHPQQPVTPQTPPAIAPSEHVPLDRRVISPGLSGTFYLLFSG